MAIVLVILILGFTAEFPLALPTQVDSTGESEGTLFT
jgi:hypothetical protein